MTSPEQLAYEAALHAIVDEASVLESIRTRAGNLFAATALVTSFFGGFLLSRDREVEFAAFSLEGLAVALFVILTVLTLATLWPYRMRFSVSAGGLLEIAAQRPPEDPVTDREVYRELALRYEAMYDANAVWIRRLFWCFRAAILCLGAEVAVWIGVVERTL